MSAFEVALPAIAAQIRESIGLKGPGQKVWPPAPRTLHTCFRWLRQACAHAQPQTPGQAMVSQEDRLQPAPCLLPPSHSGCHTGPAVLLRGTSLRGGACHRPAGGVAPPLLPPAGGHGAHGAQRDLGGGADRGGCLRPWVMHPRPHSLTQVREPHAAPNLDKCSQPQPNFLVWGWFLTPCNVSHPFFTLFHTCADGDCVPRCSDAREHPPRAP